MVNKKFLSWFSDIGFTCRVLIICDMMDEFAEEWGAGLHSKMREAIDEVRETALLEMERFQTLAGASGYLLTQRPPDDEKTGEQKWLDTDPTV